MDAADSNKQHSEEILHLFVRLLKPYFAISFVIQVLPPVFFSTSEKVLG